MKIPSSEPEPELITNKLNRSQFSALFSPVFFFVCFVFLQYKKLSCAAGDFDLADALDSNNGFGGKDKNKGQGGRLECLPRNPCLAMLT